MKKRLLSAALALAMVLTLIPATIVPAFAATDVRTGNPDDVSYTDAQGNPHKFFEENTAGTAYTTVSVTYQAVNDPATGKEAGKWYWTDTRNTPGTTIYYAVTDGVVASVGTSGNWYPDLDSLIPPAAANNKRLVSTSFTLLSADSLPTISDVKDQPTSLNVDVNGFALSGTLYPAVSNLTVTDKLHPLTTTGSIPALTRDTKGRDNPVPANTVYANLTATLSNVTVPSISLEGGANSVTLNNVAVGGTILMDGTTATTSNGNTTTVYSAQRLTVNNNGTNNLSTSTSLGGAVTVKGDGSTLILNNATGNVTVGVTSNGGSITVNGASVLSNITVASREGASATPPSVTITGGKVGDITRTANDSTQANVVSVASAGETGNISTDNGRVTVTQGKTGNITVGSGSLSLAGPLTAGNLTLAAAGKTTLSITGNGSNIGTVTTATAAAGGNLTISAWPTGRLNNFAGLTLTGYRGRGVKGGTFANDFNTAAGGENLWFDTDLQYVLTNNSKYALYGKKELATAISDVGSTTAGGATAVLHILCQGSTNTLHLINSGLTWAKIGYVQPTGMILPEMVNSYSIATWTSGDNTASVVAGKEDVIPLPTGGTDFKLYANGVATTVVNSITKAAVSPNTPVENQNVRVTMNGTNIQISGAVTPPAGSNIATILLNLQTDALLTTGNSGTTSGGSAETGYITLEDVQVFYNVDTKAVQFSTLQKLNGGAIVNNLGELVLNNGTGTHYTVSASLAQSASSLDLYIPANGEIQATVSGSRLQTAKDEIITQITGTGAKFEINGNRAILEAINAVQATITSDSTVSSWVTNAQNYVWRNGNGYKNASGQPNGLGKGADDIGPHSGNLSTTGNFGTDGTAITTKYCQAYVVPYLMVNVTDWSLTGTMTATMTVYYRVDVSGATYNPNEYYTVQTGRPLGALTGDMATQPVKVTFATAFPYATATQMHQDGKYVYVQDTTTKAWSITHAGSGNGSLGNIVLNATPATIELTSDISGRSPALPGATGTPPTGGKAYYDDLQAAIDDTVPGIVSSTGSTSTETMDTVTILGTYAPTECTISMTGIARKVKVISNGNRKINKGNNNTDVQTLNGYEFTIQLTRDTVVAGTVALAGQGTTQGTVSLPSSAKVGETVTVTVVPNAGQTANGVTVKTNTGATVNATSTGKVNEYSFTVPTGATSITVTPNFAASTTATFAVNTNSSQGTAVVTTGTTDGKAQQGSTVTVTTVPANSGYRTIGLTARGNNGSTAAVTRTGTNTFNVTVPAGATTVTVTPSFDINTGTLFTDVLSNHWAVSYVTWAYQNKYIEGTSTYTYSPSSYMTRGEMVAMLYKAAGSPSVAGLSNPFTDVTPTSHWAYNAFIWAYHQGLISGGTINPFGYATRAEIVQILYKRAGSPTVYGTSGFADVASNAAYAKAVTWARQKGLTNGYNGNTYFRPGYAVSRAEMAAFLQRAFG
ncbi:MAG: hypothetical protein HDT33_05655 [Clostridiales bacterium]|nr:hypothetical protein [Clostridiales bacterium]